MTIDEIKELIRVVHETGVAELEVQRGDNRVRIRSAGHGATESINLPAGGALAQQPSAAIPMKGPDSKVHQLPVPPDDERHETVKSPIVGTYYDSPTPGSGPFVRIGERVEPKQVLCIIESMKLMNEIEADFAGVVVAKHVENGRPVEYGELLFTISPL